MVELRALAHKAQAQFEKVQDLRTGTVAPPQSRELIRAEQVKRSSASRLSDLCREVALARIKTGLPTRNACPVSCNKASNYTALVEASMPIMAGGIVW
jgi:hypothetical protein